MSLVTDKLVEKKCKTLEEAQTLAGAEAANTGGFPVPVVVFRQGSRFHLTGALPMIWLKSRLEARSAPRRGSLLDTRSALNRPEIEEHTRAIANYLKENFRGPYIIPPLTLNIQQQVNLYTVDFPSRFWPGYLVIPATAKLAITDGQHRRSGIIAAIDEMPEEQSDEFNRDAVAVMITCEDDIKQVHQDFADCSKTKSLPASMLAVYDMRNIANRLVVDLAEQCQLFRGRIDTTSKTLSKRSTFLFLANQVRQLVKELIVGSYAVPDQEFERLARERLSKDSQFQDALDKFSEYIDHLSEAIPVWKEIARLPDSIEAGKIREFRGQGWVCLTATGLNLIGRVGYRLFSVNAEKNWKPYADKLALLDWRREAEIWQGNIVLDNKIVTQQAGLKGALPKVCQAIGLS